MAKKKSKTTADTAAESTAKPVKKPSRAGAVFGSILLFLLTLIFGICLLLSITLHTIVPQNALSKAVSQMDLSQAQLCDDDKMQPLGKCMYDWYFWNAPNLSEEYANVLVQQPEFNTLLCDYLDDLSGYLSGDIAELPEASVTDIADLMQNDLGSTMQEETGVIFAEADRQALEWTMGDDVNDWNHTLKHTIGSGFGKFLARMLCSISGIIVFGIMTAACFVLWLILAVRGHWRKGRMLTAYGCAVAIPSLLVLAESGITALLVEAFHVPDALLFTRNGLSVLLIPVVLSSLTVALSGMIVASVGICTNAVVKAKAKKKAAAVPEKTSAPLPSEPEFRYTEADGQDHTKKTDDTPTVKFCPHCGAENPLDSMFCGSCGEKMQ